MSDIQGFMSYARSDDDHDGGRIGNIKTALAGEVAMQLGVQSFVIFQDKEQILWGERWENAISGAIDQITVFLAIITPRFFSSENCISEYNAFLKRENELGRNDLIFPLIYVPVDDLLSSDDPIKRDIASRNLLEWNHKITVSGIEEVESLRPYNTMETVVRKKIQYLASQMVASLNKKSSKKKVIIKSEDLESQQTLDPDQGDDDAPGIMDINAETEDAMEALPPLLEAYTQQLNILTEIVTGGYIERLNTPNQTEARKLQILHELANDFEGPAQTMLEIGAEYAELLTRLDVGIGLILDLVPNLTGKEDIQSAQTMLNSIVDLNETANEGLDGIESFKGALLPILNISKVIRPVTRKIIKSADFFIKSRAYYNNWYERANSGLNGK